MSEPCWVPARLVTVDGVERCEWIDVAGVRFIEPLFEASVARVIREGGGRRFTPVEAILEAPVPRAAAPGAFIFHVSRCGSTLFAQLLALDARNVVVSEAPVLDQLLRSSRVNREEYFTRALSLLGQLAPGGRLFVKADCWHVFHASELRQWFPGVPFILLYRAPAAVLASQRRMRGMHMVPGLLDPAPFTVAYDPERVSLDQYAAAVLEHHYRALSSLSASDARSLLVSYDEGFPAAFLRAARWMGLPDDAPSRAQIALRCATHAKRPFEPFQGDPAAGIPGVDLTTLEAVWQDLERRRPVRSTPEA